MQAAVRDLMLAAGLQDVRRAVHSLRHTVGADLRKRGADIRDIQDVLRHAGISTTQIYTLMAREQLRKKLPRRFVQYEPQEQSTRDDKETRPGERGTSPRN